MPNKCVEHEHPVHDIAVLPPSASRSLRYAKVYIILYTYIHNNIKVPYITYKYNNTKLNEAAAMCTRRVLF